MSRFLGNTNHSFIRKSPNNPETDHTTKKSLKNNPMEASRNFVDRTIIKKLRKMKVNVKNKYFFKLEVNLKMASEIE